MKRAFHYVAQARGNAPIRVYHGNGRLRDTVAWAFAKWTQAPVTLWAGNEPGVYRAQWFDRITDIYRETDLTILEEQCI